MTYDDNTVRSLNDKIFANAEIYLLNNKISFGLSGIKTSSLLNNNPTLQKVKESMSTQIQTKINNLLIGVFSIFSIESLGSFGSSIGQTHLFSNGTYFIIYASLGAKNIPVSDPPLDKLPLDKMFVIFSADAINSFANNYLKGKIFHGGGSDTPVINTFFFTLSLGSYNISAESRQVAFDHDNQLSALGHVNVNGMAKIFF